MRSLGIARPSHRVRLMAGALSAAVLVTSVAVTASPAAAARLEAAGGPEDLVAELEALDEELDVESPPWEDSTSVPIVEPEAPDEVEIPEPAYPSPGTLDQSLRGADAADLEATAERPVVLRPVAESDADPASPPAVPEPSEDAPAADAPAADAPAEDAPADDALADDAPTEDAPAEDAPSEDAPADEAPAADVPTEESKLPALVRPMAARTSRPLHPLRPPAGSPMSR